MKRLPSVTVERIFCIAILQTCPIELQAKVFGKVVEISKDAVALEELNKWEQQEKEK